MYILFTAECWFTNRADDGAIKNLVLKRVALYSFDSRL